MITVTATDEAGNTSVPSEGLSITIDTIAPAAPVITTTTALTNDNTPTIEGTAEAGSTVELFNGSDSLGTVVAADDGSFSITPSELDDANYTLTVTATDEAGNISDPSAGLPITIDTTAPAQPAITQPVITTETLIINENRPVLEGTADPGSVVKFLIGGQEIGLSSITSTEGIFIFDFTK